MALLVNVILVVSNEQIVTTDGVAIANGIGLIIILVVVVTCEHPAAAARV